MKEIVHDVDILAASRQPEETMKAFLGMPIIEAVLAQGGTKASVRVEDDFQVDLRVIEPGSWGAAMHYFTGSKAHNIRMRERAIKLGFKLNEYGLYDSNDKQIAGIDEAEIFAKLGLPYIPPVLREDQGEMEAAAEGRLPKLIELEDIRGDLHMHTSWTDGKYSTEEMVRSRAQTRLQVHRDNRPFQIARCGGRTVRRRPDETHRRRPRARREVF